MGREHLVVVHVVVHGPHVGRYPRPVRIRAIAVFEGVVYQCFAVDLDRPDRPTLEVDAVLRPGDADDGPILLPVPTFMALLGGAAAAEPHLRDLSRRGRLVERQGVAHISFPLWEHWTDGT